MFCQGQGHTEKVVDNRNENKSKKNIPGRHFEEN